MSSLIPDRYPLSKSAIRFETAIGNASAPGPGNCESQSSERDTGC